MTANPSAWRTRGPSWEQRRLEKQQQDSDEDTDLDELGPEECSQEFFDLVVALKLKGDISAKTACTLAFWAKGAGMSGIGAVLAASPNQTGGNYSTHFDKAVGLDLADQGSRYMTPLLMPGHQRCQLGRATISCDAALAYHMLAEELASKPAMDSKAELPDADHSWTPAFTEHPLVQAKPSANILPVALYLDGVAFQKRDTTLGFWLVNLRTNRRHLLLCLRRRQMCRCGCRNWCTLWVAFSYIAWLIETLASGHYPGTAPDGKPWRTGSPQADVAGEPLGFYAAVLFVKADWAEFSHSIAMPAWNHHKHPCFACFCSGGPQGSIKQVTGVSPLELPWRPKALTDYESACAACETRITITSDVQLRLLISKLSYEKRRQGKHGRSLTEDLPSLALRKGMRLEPSTALPDIGGLESVLGCIPPEGLELVFWNSAAESLTRHRNPLFGARTGLGPQDLSIDEMHTMHLGVFQTFAATVFWQMLENDVYDLGQGLSEDATIEHGVTRLRFDLEQWYQKQSREHPERPLYILQDFGRHLLSSKDKGSLGAKGAESGTLLFFAADMADLHKANLPGGLALARAGQALVQYMKITRRSPLRVAPADHQALVDTAIRFMTLREKAGIPYKPKMHLYIHLVYNSGRLGDPLHLGTWIDEGLNRQLAAVCRSAHKAVWHRRVLATFNHSAGPTAKAVQGPGSKKRGRAP